MSSRSDTVREKLEQMIVEGAFGKGERLDENKLASRFAVSRTPVREAFQALAAAGLIELRPRSGAFVRHPAFEEIIEMFEVMAEMEAFCGRLAAHRGTHELIERLKLTVEVCEEAVGLNDSDTYYRANEEFHHLIYEASGNGFLAAEASRLHRRLKPFRRMQLKARGRLKQSLEEHRKILASLIEGDAGAAADLLREHVAVQGGKFNDLIVSYRSSARRPKAEAQS
ncbi:MAG: GntR family transcriptional regulator [Mesorhizobium amorphae]|nr:MAG: GntR family transcriptional regulator [Mesorhizobium amorphae]